MTSEFYVAEDGSIHRNPVTVVNNTGNRTNTYAPAPAAAHTQAGTGYRPIHQVSEGRIIWFWVISIVMAEVYGSDGGFIATIGPFVVFAGSILYGIFCAKSVDYNLWAYILSALSSVGGIVATGIAVAIICFVVMILFYILIIGFVIAIICGILGGA